MNTTSRANELLQQALQSTREAEGVINDLIVANDYQDVAALVTQAAETLLQAAALLMQGEGDAAFDQIDRMEDLLDSVYSIIDGEIDEDE